MKRLVLSVLCLGILSSTSFAKDVKTCDVLRNYDFGTMKIDCGNGHTTLTAMYKKGWRFIGSAISGSGGGQVILEK